MPIITVKTPPRALDVPTRAHLAQGLTAAAADAERIPLDPRKRFLCWVVFEEAAPHCWYCGGVEPPGDVLPITVDIALPDGVLDAASRALYASRVHTVFAAALAGPGRPRPLTSCVLREVPEGRWAANGTLWNLADFAREAGFAHLQPAANTQAGVPHHL